MSVRSKSAKKRREQKCWLAIVKSYEGEKREAEDALFFGSELEVYLLPSSA